MSSQGAPQPMVSRKLGALKGVADVPGDKSISHRSLIFGALSIGETKITGLLEGEDIMATKDAMIQFGAEIEKDTGGVWHVHGVGVSGFKEPEDVIDCGNAGTGVRLIMGAMATTPIAATFTGDASLRSRPMARITDPLALFGAQAFGRAKGRLPLTLVGTEPMAPVEYTSPHASAQIKSAVLLAGLAAPGHTVLHEKTLSRDHSEKMLAGFGAEVATEHHEGGVTVTLVGQPTLTGQTLTVPRDPSSAAFPICAALIVEGSEVLVPRVGMNPTRTGLITTLLEMGADLTFENEGVEGGEPIADIRVRYSPNLKGVDVPPDRSASMIDEYPVLSMVAANAEGKTAMRGIGEMRVKECDRIDATARGLEANGVTIEEGADYLIVDGMGGTIPGGGEVVTHLDHRIAMSFMCLGLSTKSPVKIDDAGPILTSFPNFVPLMDALGARFERSNH
ncbi:MAG: 3-phosphoshikimate 1-carboxyvinyltransferase [Pseudomonadota bacterium]